MAETKKFSPMRYTASTEEAAVQGALQIVGASRDEIEYEVLDQSEKGVTVRIKPNSGQPPAVPAPAPEPEPIAPVESVAATAPIVEDVPELLAQDEVEEAPVESHFDLPDEEEFEPEADSDEDEDEASDDDSDYDAPDSSVEEEEAPVAEVVVAAPVAPLDPELVANAQHKAHEFLDKMGLEASVRLGQTTDANTVALIIEGSDVGILIGKHGATLQSFQYLLNLTLNAHNEGDGIRVVVDAGNYRARRQSSLEQTARSAASKARRESRSIRLEPMPAHERRLVHMFLQTEQDIVTQSEGREPMRRIVISPSSGTRSSSPRSGYDRPAGGDRPFGNDRPYGDRRGGGTNSGMGGYGRRDNGGGNNGGNRGYNRGR